ncbi:MAG: hypothetical protein ACI9LZ_003672 [Glaciecola sp.]|jgi:hypothetical protein
MRSHDVVIQPLVTDRPAVTLIMCILLGLTRLAVCRHKTHYTKFVFVSSRER